MKLNSAAAPVRSGSGRAVEFGQTALTRCLSWRHCQLGDRRLPEMYDIRGICPPPNICLPGQISAPVSLYLTG